MTRKEKLIAVARIILPKLKYLLSEDEANQVKKELESLLELQNLGAGIDSIADKIHLLLSRNSATREWMEEHFPDSRVRSARPREDRENSITMKSPATAKPMDVFKPSPGRSKQDGFREEMLEGAWAPKSHDSPDDFNTNDEKNVEKRPPLYPVWYGTNRKPLDEDDYSKGFANEQANFGDVYYGKCLVSVPKSHRFGEIGRPWWKRLLTLNFEDDHLRLKKIISAENAEDFWNKVKHQLADNPADEREALVFLHGYNNSFEEAAIRAAQIGFDLKAQGMTAFFSWPSKDNTKKYSADEATIQRSEKAITEFLLNFTRKSGANRVHLIAHSMGNRGLLRALEKISHKVSGDTDVPFGQIILAAPDLDVGLFRNVAEVYSRLSERTTLYVSPADKAVGLSRWLHDSPRVGIVPPVTIVEGVDTIEVNIEGFNLLQLGHSYFAEAEGVLHDMFDVLRRNSPPGNRQRLKPKKTSQGDRYWLINT